MIGLANASLKICFALEACDMRKSFNGLYDIVCQQFDDTVELTELLRERFDRDKIYLLGHSWGSVIGAKAAARHPQSFHAYIGVSQVTDAMAAQQLVYQRTLLKARSLGESEAIAELEQGQEERPAGQRLEKALALNCPRSSFERP